MKENITGAGIVPVLDNTTGKYQDLKKDILFLILIDNKNRYDFPKGGIEYGEYSFDCALRETYEECCLTRDDFESFYNKNENDAFKCGNGLLMFLGFLKNINNIKIQKNPITGHKEHRHFIWLTYEEIIEKKYLMYSFLIPVLEESNNIIKQKNYTF